MNVENLNTLIERYEAHYELINGPQHNEKFKWAAIRCFQDVWFSEAAKDMPFDKKFKLAMKESSFLVDGSFAHPTAGIIKMAQQRPAQVASLFDKLLFVPYDSLWELQRHMDSFLEQITALWQELFPKYFSYKQTRHAVSCYLTLFTPEKHFLYRPNCVRKFALYTEYDKKIGSGASFNLPNFYELSEIVVQALRKHPTLMQKYNALFKDDERYYYDESLHMMVYDLMYCCNCYDYYEGLSYTPVAGTSVKKAAQLSLQQSLRQRELQEKIEKDDREIEEAQLQLDQLEIDEISLLGVEVTHGKYGSGNVTEQQANKITVRFGDDKIVKFVLSDMQTNRPGFEGEADVLPIFGRYARLTKKIKELEEKRAGEERQLKRLDIKA